MAITSTSMTDFIMIAIIFAIFFYGFYLFKNDQDSIAIRLRKDGSHDYKRVPSSPDAEFPIWIKITIFILIASVLFIPLDFILNRY